MKRILKFVVVFSIIFTPINVCANGTDEYLVTDLLENSQPNECRTAPQCLRPNRCRRKNRSIAARNTPKRRQRPSRRPMCRSARQTRRRPPPKRGRR